MPMPQGRRWSRHGQTVILAFLILVNTPLLANDAPANIRTFNVTCPAASLLPIIDASYHACNNGYDDGSCDRFVDAYAKLLPTYDCQRPIDATPVKKFVVPAIWLAEEGAEEDYIRLLWRLASEERMYTKSFPDAVRKARLLFASKEFAHSLDGAVAEEWNEKHEQIARAVREEARNGMKAISPAKK